MEHDRRFELLTTVESGRDSTTELIMPILGGGDKNRTCDLLLAKQPLYQLSYTPVNSLTYYLSYYTPYVRESSLVRQVRLELTILSALASKTRVYTIPPLTHLIFKEQTVLYNNLCL